MQPLCETDPMLVLEFSMLVLESCPSQTIELFLSGNIPADMVNSYLKQHSPNMQATYLELMLAMNENAISGYPASYDNPEIGYGAITYTDSYGMHQIQAGVDACPQYTSGAMLHHPFDPEHSNLQN